MSKKEEMSIEIAKQLIERNNRRIEELRGYCNEMEAKSLNLKQKVADANHRIKLLKRDIESDTEEAIALDNDIAAAREWLAEYLVDTLALEKFVISLYGSEMTE